MVDQLPLPEALYCQDHSAPREPHQLLRLTTPELHSFLLQVQSASLVAFQCPTANNFGPSKDSNISSTPSTSTNGVCSSSQTQQASLTSASLSKSPPRPKSWARQCPTAPPNSFWTMKWERKVMSGRSLARFSSFGRGGGKLYGTYDDDRDDYLDKVVRILGKLPEPWWKSWEMRKVWYEDEADEQGRVVEKTPEKRQGLNVVCPNTGHVLNPRSLREALANGLVYEGAPCRGSVTRRGIEKGEVELLADLLGRLLRFDVGKRMSAREALEHEWFKMQV